MRAVSVHSPVWLPADGVESSGAELPCEDGDAETVSEQLLRPAGEAKAAKSDSESSDSSDSEEEKKEEEETKTEQKEVSGVMIHWYTDTILTWQQ